MHLTILQRYSWTAMYRQGTVLTVMLPNNSSADLSCKYLLAVRTKGRTQCK